MLWRKISWPNIRTGDGGRQLFEKETMKSSITRIVWVIIVSLWLILDKTVPALTSAGSYQRKLSDLITNQAPAEASPIYLPVVVGKFPTTTIFGIEMASGITIKGGLYEMVQAGASWIRRNSALLWSEVEAQPGLRNWSKTLEAELTNAAQ